MLFKRDNLNFVRSCKSFESLFNFFGSKVITFYYLIEEKALT